MSNRNILCCQTGLTTKDATFTSLQTKNNDLCRVKAKCIVVDNIRATNIEVDNINVSNINVTNDLTGRESFAVYQTGIYQAFTGPFDIANIVGPNDAIVQNLLGLALFRFQDSNDLANFTLVNVSGGIDNGVQVTDSGVYEVTVSFSLLSNIAAPGTIVHMRFVDATGAVYPGSSLFSSAIANIVTVPSSLYGLLNLSAGQTIAVQMSSAPGAIISTQQAQLIINRIP